MNNMAKCGESSFNRKVKVSKYGERMIRYIPEHPKKTKDGYTEYSLRKEKTFAEPIEVNVKHNITGSDLHRLKNRKTGRVEWLYRRELPKDERQVRKWKQGHDGRFCSL